MPEKIATVPTGPEDETPISGVATGNPDFFCLLTEAGSRLEAAAKAAGKPIVLSHISVGDGGGESVTPDVSVEALVQEVYRRPIDTLSQDETDINICWAHIVIPASEGGWWIREFGVWAQPLDDGEPVLYAYGNHAPYYKLKSSVGQATTHELSVPIILSGTAEVRILVADAGYASRQEVQQLSRIVEALRHPQEAFWTLKSPVEEGGTLDLPEDLAYLPGEHLIDLFWNGLICAPGQQYEEIPAPEDASVSASLRLLFAAPAGSEFRIVIRPYSIQPRLV